MNRGIKIAVVDDHNLFRRGLIQLVESLDDKFKVVLEAANGEIFLQQLKKNDDLDIVILDINMPKLDGFKTVENLKVDYPNIKVLILTMNVDELSLIKMLKRGVKGYINKDIEPKELNKAINELVEKGHYYNDEMTKHLINVIKSPQTNAKNRNVLNEQELKFIKLACSEDTYKEIADTMCLSPKTIDGYRASVFEKLELKSRVGLAMYAIKYGLVEV